MMLPLADRVQQPGKCALPAEIAVPRRHRRSASSGSSAPQNPVLTTASAGKRSSAASTAAAARFAPAPLAASTSFVIAQARGARPIDRDGDRFRVRDVRQDAGELHADRRPPSEFSSRGGLVDRPEPVPRNHSTARASACSAGAGWKPSSRFAFSCVTHIFFFAMRTASSGTRGGLPVTSAHAVLHAPAQYATA